jgi:uncharacterized membrane protein YbhN (UPF0104 family)
MSCDLSSEIPIWCRMEARARSMNKRAVAIALLEVAISGGLLWVVFSRMDMAEVKERLAHLSFIGMLLVALLIALHAVLSALRWRVLVIHLGGNVTLGTALSGVLVERFVNQAVPSPIAGDGARFVEITRTGQGARIIAASIAIDRLFAFAGIFGVVALVLPAALWFTTSGDYLWGIAAIASAPFLGLAALAMVPRRQWDVLRRMPLLHYPVGLLILLRTTVLTPGVFAKSVIISIAAQTIPIPCFLILAWDLHIPLAAIDAAVFVPMILLASVIPISIAGWGVRESAAVVLLSLVGIAPSDALSLSVLYGVISLMMGCVGGIVWLSARMLRPSA